MTKRIVYYFFIPSCLAIILLLWLVEENKLYLSQTIGFSVAVPFAILIGVLTGLVTARIQKIIETRQRIIHLAEKIDIGLRRKSLKDIAKPAENLWQELLTPSIFVRDESLYTKSGILHFSCNLSKSLKRRDFLHASRQISEIEGIVAKCKIGHVSDNWMTETLQWVERAHQAVMVYLGKEVLAPPFPKLTDIAFNYHHTMNAAEPTFVDTLSTFLKLIQRDKSENKLEELMYETLLIGILGSQRTVASQYPLGDEEHKAILKKIFSDHAVELSIVPEFSLYELMTSILLKRLSSSNRNLQESLNYSHQYWCGMYGATSPAVQFHLLNSCYLTNGSLDSQCEAIGNLVQYRNILQHHINIACINAISTALKGYTSSDQLKILKTTLSYISHETMSGEFYESGYLLNWGALMSLAAPDKYESGIGLLKDVAENDTSNPIAKITALRNIALAYAKKGSTLRSAKYFSKYMAACDSKDIVSEYPGIEVLKDASPGGMDWLFTSYALNYPIVIFNEEPWITRITH